jgi:chloramphenicol-sensitive protein RarD
MELKNNEKLLHQGYVIAIAVNILWGFFPVYLKLLREIAPLEQLAYRILCSIPFLFPLLAVSGRLAETFRLMRDRAVIRAMLASATIIGINWTTYIFAVVNGHILAASLGYFLLPLISVLQGMLILKERVRPIQRLAILFGAIGATSLALEALDTLWISLVLAVSFSTYGLIRKVAPVDAGAGLTIETLLLAPFAATYLLCLGGYRTVDADIGLVMWILLVLSGILIPTTMFMFASAARKLPFATLGILLYITPSIQFLLGRFIYHEPLSAAKLVSFAVIWIGLAIFSYDAIRSARQASPAMS